MEAPAHAWFRFYAELNDHLSAERRYQTLESAVTRGYWLRQTDSRQQAAEVIRRFDLAGALRPFTRCMACNSALEAAERSAVLSRVPPRAAASFHEFLQCGGCSRVYWPGSHYRRMREWIEQLLQFHHEGQTKSYRRLE